MGTKTTLEVRTETKDRINAIKGPLTSDELINLALDQLPEARIAQLYEEWSRVALRALKADSRTRSQFHRTPRKS